MKNYHNAEEEFAAAPVPVPNCDGAERYIPADRAVMSITAEYLREKDACREGWDWFVSHFTQGCAYLELRAKLASDKKPEWEAWIKSRVGGDVATAGYSGTATAGDSGTATAGDSGTATAGYSGTVTAGYSGTATAGDRGTATAGYRGTATVGYRGVIAIQHYDAKFGRWRVIIGYIGEGGLQANVSYTLNDHAQFVRADGKEAE